MRRIRLMVITLLVSSGAAAAFGASAKATSFTLAREGKPAATIVLAKYATVAATFAAEELQYHVRKITGATLPIVAEGAKISGPRILVGESEATRALGLRSHGFRTQEYAIRFLPNTLVLIGRDADESDQAGGFPAYVPGKLGNAAQFDGARTVLAIDDAGFNDESGTMEAWIWMPARQSERHGTIFRLDSGSPWTYHIVQRDAKSDEITYTVYDGGKGAGLRSKPLTEGWHHVMATHDRQANKIELFIDGVSQGTAPCLVTVCRNCVLGIGGIARTDTHPVPNAFVGLIDEARISDIVRDPRTDAAGGPYEPDAHTTGLFHFDETAGPPRNTVGQTVQAPPARPLGGPRFAGCGL